MCTIIYYVNQLVLYFIFKFFPLHLKQPNSTKKKYLHRSESNFFYFEENTEKYFPIKIFNFLFSCFQSLLLDHFLFLFAACFLFLIFIIYDWVNVQWTYTPVRRERERKKILCEFSVRAEIGKS